MQCFDSGRRYTILTDEKNQANSEKFIPFFFAYFNKSYLVENNIFLRYLTERTNKAARSSSMQFYQME